jgi:hypothetical protein
VNDGMFLMGEIRPLEKSRVPPPEPKRAPDAYHGRAVIGRGADHVVLLRSIVRTYLYLGDGLCAGGAARAVL